MGRQSFRTFTDAQKKKSDEIKTKLCLRIKRSCQRPYWNSRTTAAELGTSRAVVCNVWRCNVDKLSYNQLFRFLIRLEPRLDVLVAT